MQLQQFENLLRCELVGATPMSLADVFGCKPLIEKMKLEVLEQELLQDSYDDKKQTKEKPKAQQYKTSHLDQFIKKEKPPLLREQLPRAADKQVHKPQKAHEPLKVLPKKRKPATPPRVIETRLQITIDLPQLQDPKTPKMMIEDIRHDLGALMSKMRVLSPKR